MQIDYTRCPSYGKVGEYAHQPCLYCSGVLVLVDQGVCAPCQRELAEAEDEAKAIQEAVEDAIREQRSGDDHWWLEPDPDEDHWDRVYEEQILEQAADINF